MNLSDDDRRRIDEEEYRKLARERLERTVRIEAEIRTTGDHRLEVRGVGTEMYRDAKGTTQAAAKATRDAAQSTIEGSRFLLHNWVTFVLWIFGLLCVGSVLYGLAQKL